MPQSDNQAEVNEHLHDDDLDASIDAALANSQVDPVQNAKDAAAAEEAAGVLARQNVAAVQDIPQPAPEPVLLAEAVKGRESLQAAFDAHRARRAAEEAAKVERRAPVLTERQRQALDEELEAGRRAQAKAQAQWDSRPVAKADPAKEGSSTPVHRPNNVVPDPIRGGNGVYGAEA